MRYVAGKHVGKVFVDGVEVHDVTECDTRLGFAIVNVRDDKGRFILDGESMKQELLTGVVTVTMELQSAQ